MSDKDESQKRNGKRRTRGVFERPAGSDVWWVCYFDEHSRKHREKVGSKALALKVYQKRKNEIQERRFFPERIGRRDVLLKDVIDDYIDRNKDKLRWFGHYERYAALWKDALSGKTVREIVPGDIERVVAKRRAAKPKSKRHDKTKPLAPATINRELAFLRRVFNVAIEDGKLDKNPVRPSMFTKENNQRVRFLSTKRKQPYRKRSAKPSGRSSRLAFTPACGAPSNSTCTGRTSTSQPASSLCRAPSMARHDAYR